jgi:hypothetical protein
MASPIQQRHSSSRWQSLVRLSCSLSIFITGTTIRFQVRFRALTNLIGLSECSVDKLRRCSQ